MRNMLYVDVILIVGRGILIVVLGAIQAEGREG